MARHEGAFSIVDGFQIKVLVLCCMPVLFYASLPLLLADFMKSQDDLWRVSSGLVLTANLLISLYIVGLQFRLSKAERTRFLAQNVASWMLVPVAVSAHVCNLAGWAPGPSGSLYLVGLWAILAIAGLAFMALIFRQVL